jgi:hypothetical protein
MLVSDMNEKSQTTLLFRYSVPARLIPLLLSIEILLFSLLFYFYPPYPFQNESYHTMPFFLQFKILILAFAVLMSGWIFRFFFFMRFSFELRKDRLIIITGSRESEVGYDRIDSIDYENMLGPSRSLFGVMTIRVRRKGNYKVFNVLRRGDEFIKTLIEKASEEPFRRKDLWSWMEIRKIDKKMGSSALRIKIWYYAMGLAFLIYMIKGYIL